MRCPMYLLPLLLISCSQISESDMFLFELQQADIPNEVRILSANETLAVEDNLDTSCIKDDLLFSYSPRGDFFYNVSSLSDGEFVGQFCRKGRGENEPVSCLPLTEVLEGPSGLYANIFSFHDAKLLKWNITESISRNTSVYDKVSRLEIQDTYLLPLSSVYEIDENHIVAYNTGQPSDGSVQTPVYELYNLESGKLESKFNVFSDIDLNGYGDEYYSPKSFRSVKDCISPNRRYLAFAMFFMPVLCILDLETGICNGYRLKGKEAFTTNPDKKACHFLDVKCDEDFIYALYWGSKKMSQQDCPDEMCVFDWNGKIVGWYKLPAKCTSLQIDGDVLYLLDCYNNTYSTLKLPLGS